MRTSVPAVEDALHDRLTAILSGVLVRFGLPTEVPTEPDRLYLIGVENLTRSAQQPTRETYTVPLVLEVERAGQDRAEPRDRMWEVIGLIVDDLAETPRVDGAADRVELAAVPEVNLVPTSDGWIARGLVHVTATALLY